MKIVLYCPNCGHEDLEFVKKDNPYLYVCSECLLEFDWNHVGFNTKKE